MLACLSLPGGQHAPRVGVLPQESEWQDPPVGVCFSPVSLQFPWRMVVLGAGEEVLDPVVLYAGEGVIDLVVLGTGKGAMDAGGSGYWRKGDGPGGSGCWRRGDGPWWFWTLEKG